MSDAPRPDARPAGRWSGWLVRAGGATLALGGMEIALAIGLAQATSTRESTLRVCALAAGALLAPTRAARALWGACGAAAALLLLVLFTPLVEAPARALPRADAEGAPVEAIVVYSAAMTDAGDIGDIALTRLVSALLDARRLGVPHLLLSVQQREVDRQPVSSAPDQRRLVDMLGGGVQLHLVEGVTNTHDESLAFAALARTRGWTRVRAVTSPLHTRRACAALEATGLSVQCAPADSRDVSLARLGTPTARLRVSGPALHELVGLLVYRARGWI